MKIEFKFIAYQQAPVIFHARVRLPLLDSEVKTLFEMEQVFNNRTDARLHLSLIDDEESEKQ